MGQNRRFRSGQKAPNDGIYVEIGETGSMVKDPQMVKLTAGEKFPDNTNHNRQWTYKKKTVKEAAIIIAAFCRHSF